MKHSKSTRRSSQFSIATLSSMEVNHIYFTTWHSVSSKARFQLNLPPRPSSITPSMPRILPCRSSVNRKCLEWIKAKDTLLVVKSNILSRKYWTRLKKLMERHPILQSLWRLHHPPSWAMMETWSRWLSSSMPTPTCPKHWKTMITIRELDLPPR